MNASTIGSVQRRHLLGLVGAAGALGAAGIFGFDRIARPAPPDGPLSAAASALLDRVWQGLDPKRVVDCHVHVVGLGSGSSGCWVNERARSLLHPIQYARFAI